MRVRSSLVYLCRVRPCLLCSLSAKPPAPRQGCLDPAGHAILSDGSDGSDGSDDAIDARAPLSIPPIDPAGAEPRRDHRLLARVSRHQVPMTPGKKTHFRIYDPAKVSHSWGKLVSATPYRGRGDFSPPIYPGVFVGACAPPRHPG